MFLFICYVLTFICTSSLLCLSCPYPDQFCFHSQQFLLSIGLCPERSPGRLVLRAHQALISPAPSGLAAEPCTQPLLEWITPHPHPAKFNYCSVWPVVLSSEYLLATLRLEYLIAPLCFLPYTCWEHVGLTTGGNLFLPACIWGVMRISCSPTFVINIFHGVLLLLSGFSFSRGNFGLKTYDAAVIIISESRLPYFEISLYVISLSLWLAFWITSLVLSFNSVNFLFNYVKSLVFNVLFFISRSSSILFLFSSAWLFFIVSGWLLILLILSKFFYFFKHSYFIVC